MPSCAKLSRLMTDENVPFVVPGSNAKFGFPNWRISPSAHESRQGAPLPETSLSVVSHKVQLPPPVVTLEAGTVLH